MRTSLYILFALAFTFCARQDSKTGFENIHSVVHEKSKILSQNPLNAISPARVFVKDLPKPEFVAINEKSKGEITANTLSKKTSNLISSLNWLGDFKTYTTDDGLPLDAVYCITNDRKGNIWLGSDGGGLSCYNGKTFTNYTNENGLPNVVIRRMFEDDRGNLWIGTYGGGISCFDGKSFMNYGTEQGLCSNEIFSGIQDSKGKFWFGSYGNGFSLLDPSKLDTNCFKLKCTHDLTNKEQNESHNKAIRSALKNYVLPGDPSSNIILSIIEDHVGRIWFGTNGGGVFVVEGHSFESSGPQFIHIGTKNGLTNERINQVFQDQDKNIWFATDGGGVNCIGLSDENRSCFENACKHNLSDNEERKEHYRIICSSLKNYSVKEGLADNYVRCICEDKSNNIWFGTLGGGASCFNKNFEKEGSESFTNYSNLNGLANNVIWSLANDKNGNVWLGTDGGGISSFHGNAFMNFTGLNGVSINSTRSIVEDKNGNLWLATFGAGLYKFEYDLAADHFKLASQFTKESGLADNYILAIEQDKNNGLLLGTYGGGINYLKENRAIIYSTKNGLPNDIVWSIVKDKIGNYWIATGGGGVSYFDGSSFTNYTTKQGLVHDVIRSAFVDSKGRAWFGSVGSGVSCFDGVSFTNYNTSNGLIDNVIWTIKEDKYGNIWFGTSKGLSRFDGKTFLNINKENGIPDNVITQIVFDEADNIVVGTNYGIAVLKGFSFEGRTNSNSEGDKKYFKIQNTSQNSNLFNTLLEVEVFNSNTGYPVKDVNIGQGAMFKDAKGIIWIGTGANKTGLVRFDSKQINSNKPKPKVFIQDIKIHNEQICWSHLSFSNALLNAKHQVHQDTLRSKQLELAAINDEMISLNRKLSVKERSELANKYKGISFSDLSDLYFTPNNLVLPYKQNNITFEFGSIVPSKTDQCKYQFILLGYDKTWSPVSNITTATYGNMYEGNYSFIVRAKLLSGEWGTPTVYTFKVLPPIWREWWMYLIYCLVFSGLIYLFIQINTYRLNKKAAMLKIQINTATKEITRQKEEVDHQRELAQERLLVAEDQQKVILRSVEEMKAIQLKLEEAKLEAERANKAKTEFLSNMSHEIRTPLNAVLGFSELLKGNIKEEKYEKYVDGILTGGKNLLALINDILDLSKIEAGKLEINNAPINLRSLCNDFQQIFAQNAISKGLKFNVDIASVDHVSAVWIDETRIRQILFNLLGNAFKFTDNGKVDLLIRLIPVADTSDFVDIEFCVKDTGIGIPPGQQKLIFESFKQQDGQSTRKYGGTGLGLAITKRLVDLMGGEIELISEPNKGSKFCVTIRKVKIAASWENEIEKDDSNAILFSGQHVLLVEDIESNREVIKGILERHNLKVTIAENGREALELMNTFDPDLIIMDLMMPVMDGFTAAKAIRSIERLKKVPLLFLTASVLKVNESELSKVSDDILLKPINKHQLITVLTKYLKNISSVPPYINENLLESELVIDSEIKVLLKERFYAKYLEILKMMSIDDIQKFASEIHDFSKDTNQIALTNYAGNILKLASEFEIGKMNSDFRKFEDFLK